MKNNKRVLGNALLMLTAMIWGTAFVFQRVGMEDIEPITFNAARMALAAVAVGAVSMLPMASEKGKLAIMSREARAAYRRNTIVGGICCGAFLAAASIFQQMGIVYTTAGKAGFITAMYMLLVPVIGFLFLGKRNSWIVWLAVLMGVVGMYLLCMTESLHLGRGDTLVCICLFYSGPDTGTAKLGQNSVSRHSDPLLRSHLGRTGLYAADHCAEVHRSCCCVTSHEFGIGVCGYCGCSAPGREDDRQRTSGLCDHVRRDRAGADPWRVNKSPLCPYLL